MKSSRLLFAVLFSSVLALSGSAFADKVGVAFEGDAEVQKAIADALTADGHEIVDVSEKTKNVHLDAVAASSIGKATGTSLIIAGKKLGPIFIIKVLSTKNDTVAGGTTDNAGSVVEQVKKILGENKEKLGL